MIETPETRDCNHKNNDSADSRSDVILLNDKQWSYVQSRYDLTPRERQIAELICQGYRNGKIASVLRIKPGTVKTHTRNIYRKVHVKSKIGMLLQFVTDTRDLFSQYDGFHPAISTD
jgi:DNA-binding NarL/FixJ family response regulator